MARPFDSIESFSAFEKDSARVEMAGPLTILFAFNTTGPFGW